ncbi:MAG: hypothetical protein ACYCW6_19160, partial [Candidatus Xenobia bacterium]
ASLAAPLAMASAVGELSEAKQDGVEALHLHKFIKQTREALETLTPEQAAQLAELKSHDRKLFVEASLKALQGGLLMGVVPAVLGAFGPAGLVVAPILAAAAALTRVGQAVWEKFKGPDDEMPALRGLETGAPPLTEKPLEDPNAFRDINRRQATKRDAKLEAAGVSQPWPRMLKEDEHPAMAIVPVAVPASMLVKNPTTGKMELPEGTTLADPQVATATREEFTAKDQQWRAQTLPAGAQLAPNGSKGGQLIDALWMPGVSIAAGLGSRGVVSAELKRAVGSHASLSLGLAAPFMAVLTAISMVGARDLGAAALNQKALLDTQEKQLREKATQLGQDPDAAVKTALEAPRSAEHSMAVSAVGMAGRGLLLAGATTALAVGGAALAPLAVGLVLGAGLAGVGTMAYTQRELLATLGPNLKLAAPILAKALVKLPVNVAKAVWHKLSNLMSRDDEVPQPAAPSGPPPVLDPFHVLAQ